MINPICRRKQVEAREEGDREQQDNPTVPGDDHKGGQGAVQFEGGRPHPVRGRGRQAPDREGIIVYVHRRWAHQRLKVTRVFYRYYDKIMYG